MRDTSAPEFRRSCQGASSCPNVCVFLRIAASGITDTKPYNKVWTGLRIENEGTFISAESRQVIEQRKLKGDEQGADGGEEHEQDRPGLTGTRRLPGPGKRSG